jgi:hypothetical protein
MATKAAAKKKTAAKKKKSTSKRKNENKTRPTAKSVRAFVAGIEREGRRRDCKRVIEMMKRVTGQKPKLWGSIFGFGTYHYKYDSGREGDFFLTGVAPRKANLTVYIMPGFAQYGGLLSKLGKHKTAKSCLYIKRLDDVHLPTLEKLVARSVKGMRRRYPQ